MATELNVVPDTDTSPFAGLPRDPQSISDENDNVETKHVQHYYSGQTSMQALRHHKLLTNTCRFTARPEVIFQASSIAMSCQSVSSVAGVSGH